jgi:hypothetical protein
VLRNREWLVFSPHPRYPHGTQALVRGKNGTARRIGTIFDEKRNPNRPRDCPPPPSTALFTVECYFPCVLGRGADGIAKCANEKQARRELERRFTEFLEDVVFHRGA